MAVSRASPSKLIDEKRKQGVVPNCLTNGLVKITTQRTWNVKRTSDSTSGKINVIAV